MVERLRPAGYSRLVEEFGLDCMPHWHRSLIDEGNASRKTVEADQHTLDIFSQSYWPGPRWVDHLEFALKYDGVNLALLWATFHALSPAQVDELGSWILSKPTGKYARRAWFLYEYLTERKLEDVEDLKRGSYVDLLDPKSYFTLPNPARATRYRINNNLLGTQAFCPIVRRSSELAELESIDLKQEFEQALSAYPKNLLDRSIGYLYNAETKSSFQIEAEAPSRSKTQSFVALLERAHHDDYVNKSALLELQHQIVDPRFREDDFRQVQNYVGRTIHYGRERIHYVCPHPKDVPGLMQGLLETHEKMMLHCVPALMHAALISYAFVFLHPFEDGNGRIHRFLIHNILQLKGAAPEGLIFPVSATMLKYAKRYTESLEAFSKPLLSVLDYELDDDGQMELKTPHTELYRFMDLTAQTQALVAFVRNTIEEQVIQELEYLASFDQAKESMETVVELPDRLVNLFIKCCTQNGGRLSATKRKKFFDMLSDEEVQSLQAAVQEAYGIALEAKV